MIFLGVDVGGTKTDVLVVNEMGRVLGRYIGGPGNHESLGVEGAYREINRSIKKALRKADLDKSEVDYAFFGMAGFDHEEDRDVIDEILRKIGLKNYSFDNDGRIALKSGTGDDIGIMVSCGTGSVSYASDGRKISRIGGYSWGFGERLGSYLISGMITSAVVRSKDGRGYKSKLVEKVESEIGMSVEKLRRISRNGVSALSEYVPRIISSLFWAYEDHDFVATKIVLEIAEEVVKIASAHRRVLHLKAPVKLVLEGTFFKKSPKYFLELISSALGEEFYVSVPKHPPVVGAVLLAMDMGKLNSKEYFEKIISQINRV